MRIKTLFAMILALAWHLTAKAQVDPHSFANLTEVRIQHMSLDLTLDFKRQKLMGSVTHSLFWKDPHSKKIVLDTNGLKIHSVEIFNKTRKWQLVPFQLSPQDPIRGQALVIHVPEQVQKLRIQYETTKRGTGLQWLPKTATADKIAPFMFSQSQSIHGRSWIPMQDTPAIRVTYDARVRAPKGIRVLMSANNDPAVPDNGEFTFHMDQPIAPYLLAIAAGHLKFHSWSPRSGVWAEPSVLPRAAKEFEDTEKMIQATEAIYGPYVWKRYDLLILPPSFPYGGMENPRLSFITPTVIVGDKSLVSLITHELAHSWSGNLVTNKTWRDFWLNEGITSYLENRILEKIYGPELAKMEQVITYRDMMNAFKTEIPPSEQGLVQNLDNKHPDDAWSPVVYNKGQFLMHTLERIFGRAKLDRFLKQYFAHFKFKTITSEEFARYIDRNLFAPNKEKGFGLAELNAWLFGPGLPDHFVPPTSKRLANLDRKVSAWVSGRLTTENLHAHEWSTQEWVYFLGQLAPKFDTARLAELDKQYNLSSSPNAEIGLAWLPLAIRSGYQGAHQAVERHLGTIGRNRLILPVYRALSETSDGLATAKQLFTQFKDRYHPQTVQAIAALLAKAEKENARQ